MEVEDIVCDTAKDTYKKERDDRPEIPATEREIDAASLNVKFKAQGLKLRR